MGNQEYQPNSRRIAKNTLFLYFRMLFAMFVSLYTSRAVLNVLGVDDFGTYNVVGGIVTVFSFLSSSITIAYSRFLMFEMGKGDVNGLNRVFSMCMNVQIIQSVIVFLVLEIVGTWFLGEKMNFPEGRDVAVRWVLQLTIVSFTVLLLTGPYNQLIISHERMDVHAYLSIGEVCLKLIFVLLLPYLPGDKLIVYAILLFVVTVGLRVVYYVYCKKSFPDIHYVRCWDQSFFQRMLGLAGWNLVGQSSIVINNQGIELLTNVFFGVTVNAARAIAAQVESIASQFVSNFTMALNPQIIKSYAAGEVTYMQSLLYQGAKYSFFLMIFLAVPICLETEIILHLWLKNVPNFSVVFVRLSFLVSVFNIVDYTLSTAMVATGQIRNYQIVTGLFRLLNFPLVYIAYRLGASPAIAYISYAGVNFLMIFIRLFIAKLQIGLSISRYIHEVFLTVLIVFGSTLILPLFLCLQMPDSIHRLFLVIGVSFFSCAISVYRLGLKKSEREYVKRAVSEWKNRFHH